MKIHRETYGFKKCMESLVLVDRKKLRERKIERERERERESVCVRERERER